MAKLPKGEQRIQGDVRSMATREEAEGGEIPSIDGAAAHAAKPSQRGVWSMRVMKAPNRTSGKTLIAASPEAAVDAVS